MRKPMLVAVSGPPGAGKTTLAHALARAIGCPAICRDEIKEGMVHAEGGGFEGEPGDRLTQRTYPLFFDVLRLLVGGGVTVVGEAAFQDTLWRGGLEPLADLAELRVVQCRVDLAVSFERARERATVDHRRRAHGDSSARMGFDGYTTTYASFDRLSLPVPSIDVDTTDGYDPPLAAIAAFVSR